MLITKITAHKEFKVGLPNYSNITASCGLEAEVAEGENPDWNEIWDIVNSQLSIQTGNIDPSWIETKSFNNFFKTTIKTNK